MKGSNDPAARAELDSLIASGGAAATAAIADVASNPATVQEFTAPGSVGLGRWGGGKFLTVNTNSGVDVHTLTGNQSLHFMYGPEPGPIPVAGSATYNFIGGTRSTSVSGATIGNGVTSGSIAVNFGTSGANLNMIINHLTNYSVSGPLSVDTRENGINDTGSVFATTDMTGPCYPSSCTVFIDGGFAGPNSTSVPGTPAYIGIEYDIQTSDVITGVAGFAN
jgi:hypothetical protein